MGNRKNDYRYLYITMVTVMAIITIGIGVSRFGKKTVCSLTKMDSLEWKEGKWYEEEDLVPGRFYTRFIDTINQDTMFFVCRLTEEGDTIPDLLDITYGNGEQMQYRYYLTRKKDTILLDHDQTDALIPSHCWEPDSTAPNDSLYTGRKEELFDEISREVIESLSAYLRKVAMKDTIE